jgi:hypothetical protein
MADRKVGQIHLLAGLEKTLPFTLEDAMRHEEEVETAEQQLSRVLLPTRLDNRVVDLRVCIPLSPISIHTLICIVDTNSSERVQAAGCDRRPVPPVPQPEALC